MPSRAPRKLPREEEPKFTKRESCTDSKRKREKCGCMYEIIMDNEKWILHDSSKRRNASQWLKMFGDASMAISPANQQVSTVGALIS